MPYKLSMKWSLRFFGLLCASSWFVQSGFAQSTPKFNCEPSFPLAQGWQGADAAYSIPLDDRRDLWIFGDTLYGDERKVVGDAPRMVRNTVGISTCKDGHWKVDYTIRRGVDEAWASPPRPELRQRVLSRYTWEQTAHATAAAYGELLGLPDA